MATVRVAGPDDVGPALREIRVADEVTQSALADLAGVGRQWLNAFEMGDKPSAPLDMVMRVAAALDATLVLTPPTYPRGSPAAAPIDLDAHLRNYLRGAP